MKLNPECIRDILLCVEENTGTSIKGVSSEKTCRLLPKYSKEEIIYHIQQCEYHDFIFITIKIRDSLVISDLTPLGHNFLANIRSNNIWSKTKSIATNIGSTSLGALIQIATSVVSNSISNTLE